MKFFNLSKHILRKILDFLFLFLAKITKTNLIYVAYNQKGILKSGDNKISGEKFVIESILKKYIKQNNPIFFDVGSSIGSYSLSLKKQFQNSSIYAFEPNPNAYRKITKEALETNIKFYNIGLNSSTGPNFIYDYKNQQGTEHATAYKQVLTEIHKSKEVEEIYIINETLDFFCKKNDIDRIDFLKIDTEGNELEILNGSKTMLEENKINIIQFEFNEMNVISRVFLKDYYDLLKDYNIYRLDSNKLIPLPVYKTENEVFKYQNFLAINKNL